MDKNSKQAGPTRKRGGGDKVEKPNKDRRQPKGPGRADKQKK